MGDKYKSEIQKPVNNPLLSGAGHGFPFDNFQGSSLPVLVSQDSPSILSDQVGEPDKFVGQDAPNANGRLSDALNIGVEARNEQASQGTGSQYVRLFNAFFGGGGSGKSDQEPRPEKGAEQQSAGSVSSTPRSYSPYVHVPSVQTIRPGLQVPSDSPASPAAPPQGNPTPYQTSSTVEMSSGSRNLDASETAGDRPPPQPQQFTMDHPPPSGSFPNPYAAPGGSYPPPTTYTPGQPPGMNQPQPGVGQFPPPALSPGDPYHGAQGSDTSKPPLGNMNAPPMFRGDSFKNYRLCHNKRPVYAPIPGLTLSTSQSHMQSYMQPGETAPPTVSQPPLYPSAAPPSADQPPYPTGFMSSQQSAPPASSYFTPNSITQPVPTVDPPPVTSSSAQYFQSVPAPIPSVSAPPQPLPVQPPSLGFTNPPPAHPPRVPTPGQTQSPPTPSFPNPAPVQPVPQPGVPDPVLSQPVPSSFQSPRTSTPTPTAPYPATSVTSDTRSLFAPISKANHNPAEPQPVTVLNPVPVHPTGSLPSNLKPADEMQPPPSVIPPSLSNLAHVGRTGIAYRPPYHHWFYKKDGESTTKESWYPFSMTDSVALEQTYQSGKLDENTVIATNGGRYDVSILRRTRTAVYWEEAPKEVRRCSWFYKNSNESRYRPYDENTAYHLEEEYKKCVTTDTWRRRLNLSGGEYVIMYSSTNMGHFESNFTVPDGWEADFSDTAQALPSPVKMVKRGISDDFDIDDGEAPRVDHLVFVVHGIGSVCDLKFRTIEEAVDVFRSISHKLIKSHFNNSVKQGLVNRIEVLPISWHGYLHGETTGLDKRLESITLKSIPRLRNFTNDTLLDILFYTSPIYCQKIVQQVGREMISIFDKFKSRNPGFNGGVSLVGHSLGSLILFDMLCHQKPTASAPDPKLDVAKAESKLTRRMSGFVVGNADAHQTYIDYPQLPFQPIALFALGSPIGMFITVRGIDKLGLDFKLPTCVRFFNIFHPFDPVAYRVESLVNPEMADKRPVLIPHHKGRKRMHLELKETISRVSNDLKQRLVDSIRSTWNTVYHLTAFGRADDGLEQEVDKVIKCQIGGPESIATCLPSQQESVQCDVGKLNMGRRIDYVLQEAPLESVNEYVSAIRSHLIYWDSEDTILMILREIYNAEGISVDAETLAGQDGSVGDFQSPSSPGWNVTDEPKLDPAPPGLAPSYGFVQ